VTRPPRDIAASVRQRLLNLAKERGEDFQSVLTRYTLERFLFRLASSRHADRFVLKGAMLFTLWTGEPHRATWDVDLLGDGEPTPDRLENVFREVCVVAVEPDGLAFSPETVQAEAIREDNVYGGIRVLIEAFLGVARVRVQVDVGFGDAVTPPAVSASVPSLLGMPAATLAAYQREVVVAEKFEAMVALGMANSRMKDFYDLWVLASQFSFDGPALRQALESTFRRRGTTLPADEPMCFTPEFTGDVAKQAQWRAFTRRSRLLGVTVAMPEIIAVVRGFVMPVVQALVGGVAFSSTWSPGGPWGAHQTSSGGIEPPQGGRP
jgi:predicted nucleotidyltransferase component of viral defense system